MSTNNNNPAACWQVLGLVSYHLDPKTLALASCVSKSWLSCFSSDHLWDPLCSSHFPSLATLPTNAVAVPRRRRLYGLGYTASRLRNRLPRKPTLSLDDLLFTITIYIPPKDSNEFERPYSNNNNRGSGHIISVVKPCKEMKRHPQGTFRFDVDVGDDREWGIDELEGVRVTWNVIYKDWKAVFAMAEESGVKKGGFASCADGWFSEELPTPSCCSGAMSSGLVADLRLEMKPSSPSVRVGGNNKMKVKKVKVGVMCILNWRYLTIDDALSYLEHFLHV